MRLRAAAGRGAEAFAIDGPAPTGAGMDTLPTGLKRLEATRQTATLLATVRHLETATVDDALDLCTR